MLRLQKYDFGKSSVDYLGLTLEADDIKPGQRKADAIADFRLPRKMHGLSRFLGLTSFFGKFVDHQGLSPCKDY